jgi:hypothetical protein
MSKTLIGVVLEDALVVGTVVAKGAGQARLAITPEGRSCVKLKELCPVRTDASHEPRTLEACVQDLEDLRKIAGPPAVDRSMSCVNEAQSCTAALGCMAGGIGVGAMMKGFGSALSR